MPDAPAETLNFMLLGYGVILGTIAFYLISVFTRFQNMRQEIQILEEIEETERE